MPKEAQSLIEEAYGTNTLDATYAVVVSRIRRSLRRGQLQNPLHEKRNVRKDSMLLTVNERGHWACHKGSSDAGVEIDKFAEAANLQRD